MRYIRWFHEISADDVELVGGKGANLGEMTQANLPVPPGFCLTAQAYRDFIKESGLSANIADILGSLSPEDPLSVDRYAERIRNIIHNQNVPAAIAQDVRAGYQRLATRMELDEAGWVPVAVRSSATAEDLPDASFAGQQDTYLNIRGEDALLEHVLRCWASLWTARAVTYRIKQGFDHQKVYLAVVVQAMIPSEISGIMFTANPVSGARDEAVINASWGLGEAIVSGSVTPDTITVHKGRREILSQQIASKDLFMEYALDGGIVELETPEETRLAPALKEDQALAIADLGRDIEDHYGAPQDIEWAYSNERWYVLQSRPITTLAGLEEPDEYNRTMFIEIFPDPLTPIFCSVIQPLFHSMLDFTFNTWGFKPPDELEAVGVYYNQPYFNRSYIEGAFAPLSPKVREPLVAQIVNPFGDHKGGTSLEFSLPYLRMVSRTLGFLVNFPKQMPEMITSYHDDIDQLNAIPYETLTDQELVATIRRVVYGPVRKLLDNDFLLIAVIKRVYHLLGILLEPYFGEEAEELRGKLISGVTGNATMETNMHLWDLAQTAKYSPQVRDLFLQYGGEELLARLGKIPDGQDFLEELDEFLGAFGHREVRLDICYPTWSEDPSPVLGFVRGYLDVGEDQDPHLQQHRLISQRSEIEEKVRKELAGDVRGRLLIWPLFHWLLDHVEFHTRERDTMHFEMTRIFPPFRRFFNELGRRWSDHGLLEEVDDIYFMTLDEMEMIAKDPTPMGQIATTRRGEYECNKKRPWPNIIRGDQEIYPQGVSLGECEDNQLLGVSGSPGVFCGPARVICGPEDFHRLEKGDVLVAPITNPVWTPLFAIAGGVITEVGGILSHGAIVAREYGIPAVMSIPGATQRVPDGQQITVDGNKGLVYLEGIV